MAIYHANNNIICFNNITNNNRYGIRFHGSQYNKIYHNNFINNNYSSQGADDRGPNFWNASYPNGGNYWSNWLSPDNKSGQNQDQPGSDGIVDNPYLIAEGGSYDYYPLTTPPPPISETSPLPAIIISVIVLVGVVTIIKKKLP
jgi:parallel beta-helix repeat protein